MALGALGWSPETFWKSTLYELSCAYIGYCKANGTGRWERKGGYTADELEEFQAEIEEMKRLHGGDGA